jgi:hypothetical protein
MDYDDAGITAALIRPICGFTGTLYFDNNSLLMYPPNGVSYRGGGIPMQHVAQLPDHPPPFYVAEKLYRVPMFLASSFSEIIAGNFCHLAEQRGELPVIWTIKVDPRGAQNLIYRCKHVNQARTCLHLRALACLWTLLLLLPSSSA